jgi:hypothetical protein
MSTTTTAVSTARIKLSSTEVEALMDPVIGNALCFAGQDCDPLYEDTADALREGPQALRLQVEAVAQKLTRWATVLAELERGELTPEPWLIDEVREEASSQANNVRYEEETAELPYSKWLDVLNALAERLEGALVGAEVMA